MKKLILNLVWLGLTTFAAGAQPYSIDWYKVSGGGGTSAGGTYSVSGTIGQHDAGGAMSGGNYSLTGGFWAIYAVQTSGAPTLYVARLGNVVSVFWQNVPGWNAIQSANLATPVAVWPASGIPTLLGGTNYLSVTNPVGNLYFRLKQ